MGITRIALAFDPGLTPSNSGLPGGLVNWLRTLGSGILGAAFVILAITFVIAVIVWGASKAAGNQRMQSGSGMAAMIILACAFLAGGANALIRWAGQTGNTAINGSEHILDGVSPETLLTLASHLVGI